MTTETTTDDEMLIHFLGSVSIAVSGRGLGNGVVTSYGGQLIVNDEMRRLNTGRDGSILFDLVDDEAAQVSRWGRVMFRRGPWPEGVQRVEHGSPAWFDAYDAARSEAFKVEDPAERSARLKAVSDEFGGPPPTSRTLMEIRGDDGAHRA